MLYSSILKQLTIFHPHLSLMKLERVNPPPIQPQASIAVAPITPSSTSPFIQMEPTPSITGVADEYDPFRPNEYDEVVKRMKEDKEKEREKDRRREDRRDRQERERDRREERERERERFAFDFINA